MRYPSRFLPAVPILALLLTGGGSRIADAGCGCEKPPPPIAPIRPSFASPGDSIALFGSGLVAGRPYRVTFGTPGVTVDATAVLRRDFADGMVKPQLVVPAPTLAPGPTTVTVTRGPATVLTVTSAEFTMLPPPLVLLEGNVKTLVSSYQTAVGSDGTVYFPLDISAVGDATTFEGRAIGYRLTFSAPDVVIYNIQGVLMELLDAGNASHYATADEPDSALDASDGGSANTSRSVKLAYTRHQFETYLDDHAANPALQLNPGDPAWHLNGTRHIEHFRLVIAIGGLVDGALLPVSGATPSFTFRVKTKPEHGKEQEPPLQRLVDGTDTAGSKSDLRLACSSRPAAPCQSPTEPAGSSLTIKKRDAAPRDQLEWLWRHGVAASAYTFGDLRQRHALAFCLYDESAATPRLVIEAGLPRTARCPGNGQGASCWRAEGGGKGRQGLRYASPDPMPGSIAKVVVSGGNKKKAGITLRTTGDRVAVPPLPLGLPLRAQLQSTNGGCWEAAYTTGISSNGPNRFKAFSD